MLGGFGTAAGRTLDTGAKLAQSKRPPATDIPLVHSFVGQIQGLRVSRDRFYKNLDRLNLAQKELKLSGKRGDRQRYNRMMKHYAPWLRNSDQLKQAHKQLGRANRAIRKLRESKMSDAVRQRKIRAIQLQIKQMLEQVNKRMEEAEDQAA